MMKQIEQLKYERITKEHHRFFDTRELFEEFKGEILRDVYNK